jgi:hypothetical protein
MQVQTKQDKIMQFNITIRKYRQNKTKLNNSNYITKYETYNTVSNGLNKNTVNHKLQNTN